MTPEQTALVERIRARLAEEQVLREVTMFGGRSFMVNDKLAVCALKHGGLLARVPADDHERLVAEADAVQAEMGAGRTMGPGWIEFGAATLDDERLDFWLDVALRHNRAVTGADS